MSVEGAGSPVALWLQLGLPVDAVESCISNSPGPPPPPHAHLL